MSELEKNKDGYWFFFDCPDDSILSYALFLNEECALKGKRLYIDEFNKDVDEFNDLLKDYNELVDDFNKLLADYTTFLEDQLT